MSVWFRRFFSYFLSLSTITALFIYIFNLPEFITSAPNLINEYYYKNAISAFIFDIFLIAIYISCSMFISKFLKVKANDNTKQIVILAFTTLLISGSFMIYFLSGGSPNTFFSRWFKKTSYRDLIYDLILVCSVYILMIIINNKIKSFENNI
jgi:hypothetical protein